MMQENSKYVSFIQARAFAQTLNLRSKNEWYAYHKQNDIKDIPRYTNEFSGYKNDWTSWKDFLGYDKVAYQIKRPTVKVHLLNNWLNHKINSSISNDRTEAFQEVLEIIKVL